MRKLRILAIGLTIIVGSYYVLGISYMAWDRAHTFYPRPENSTLFFRGYKPDDVLASYRAESGHGEGTSTGSSAGREVVQFEEGFSYHFVVLKDKKTKLSCAVVADATERMKSSGMEILSQEGSCESRYRIEYRSARNIGVIVLWPLDRENVKRAMPLPGGMEDVRLRIDLRENWYPRTFPSDPRAVLHELPYPGWFTQRTSW